MKRRIVLLCAAALLALAGTGAVLAYVAGADARALDNTRSADVLVAAGPIAEGTSLATAQSEGLIASARFPLSALPPDALTTIAGLAEDAVASQDVAPRGIILASTFGSPTTNDDVAGLTLPPGTSAVPVSMEAFAGSEDWSGWIRPGSEVAIYLTFSNRNDEAGPYIPGPNLGTQPAIHEVTRLLFDRVTVLAVGSAPVSGAQGEESSEAGSAMVLALTQEQSERLILGIARKGLLYPALLAPDSAVAPSPGTIDDRIFDPLRTPAPRAATP